MNTVHIKMCAMIESRMNIEYRICRMDPVSSPRGGGEGGPDPPPPDFCSDPSRDLRKSVDVCLIYRGWVSRVCIL